MSISTQPLTAVAAEPEPPREFTPPHPASKPPNATKWFWGPVLLLFDDHKTRAAEHKPDVFCIRCGKEVRYNGSTGNVEAHANKHKELKPATTSGPMDAHVGKLHGLKAYIVRWMVDTYQPLSVVERESFKAMIKFINPRASVPARAQVVAWLDEFEEAARQTVIQFIREEFVALTSDAWTSANQDPYLALTAHFINSNWEQVSCT